MLVLGLTGGVGMGKSLVARMLEHRGAAVVDTDLIARELVEPGQPALTEIQDAFGREVVDSSGVLRREELARIVFADSAQRKRLETILHPRIRDQWRRIVEAKHMEAVAMTVVVIPLLFETEAESFFERVICVGCSAGVQHSRLAGRGWNSSEIQRRIAAQWPIARKMERADWVIWNESSAQICEKQLARILLGRPTEN